MGSTNDPLTKTLRSKLNNPVSSPEFDLYAGLDEVLSSVGLKATDTFYGKDPIVPSHLRFGATYPIVSVA